MKCGPELISNPEISQLFENSITGGIGYIRQPYSNFNDPETCTFKNDEIQTIGKYFDFNSLYGYILTQKLPFCDFNMWKIKGEICVEIFWLPYHIGCGKQTFPHFHKFTDEIHELKINISGCLNITNWRTEN